MILLIEEDPEGIKSTGRREISRRDEEYRWECRIPKGDSDEDVAPTGLRDAYKTHHPPGMM